MAAGVPNVAGQLAALPGDPALALLLNGEVPAESGIGRIVRSREHALEWLANPAWRIDLGATRLTQALVADHEGGDPADLLHQAREQLRAGLSRSPADSVAWLWLAVVEL